MTTYVVVFPLVFASFTYAVSSSAVGAVVVAVAFAGMVGSAVLLAARSSPFLRAEDHGPWRGETLAGPPPRRRHSPWIAVAFLLLPMVPVVLTWLDVPRFWRIVVLVVVAAVVVPIAVGIIRRFLRYGY